LSSQPNLRLKGSRRDNEILRVIEEWGVLNTDQVQAIFFAKKDDGKPFVYGQRKAQERLLDLHRSGKLHRQMVEGIYCYSLDPKGLLKHRVAVNWIRLWMPEQKATWEKFHSWNYEQDYKIVRCDGFAAYKNTVAGKFRFAFIEMDRGTNSFDKVKKYNTLYETEKYYSNSWWLPLTARFPPTVIVTVHPDRKRLIQSHIEAENKNKLEFQVKLLDDIRKEVMQKCCSPTQAPVTEHSTG